MINRSLIILLIVMIACSFLFADPPNWQQITGADYSMVLVAEITLNNPFTGVGENVAAAFGPGGESDCRSISSWDDNLQIWYFTIVGNQNGEVIDFRIYDENSDSIYISLNSIVFDSNATIGSPDNPFNILMPTFYTLDPPQNVSISINLTFGLVIISWSEVTDAESYYIYSGNTSNIDTTPGTHVGRESGTTWFGSISESRKFYTVTASDEPISETVDMQTEDYIK